MRTVLLTAHKLRLDGQARVVHENGTPFDAASYSRMKYGDRTATRDFAQELAAVIAADCPDVVFGATPPDFLVAYKALPPACYYLSRYCLDALNSRRVEAGREPGRLAQVYKNAVTATNYASASPADRQRELQSIDFTLEGRNLKDKSVTVVDDIRVTGGAERRILEIIKPSKPAVTLLGYAAILDARQAAALPSAEDALNSTIIQTAGDLLPLVKSDDFDLNIRTLKLMLSAPERVLRALLYHAPVSLIEDMLRGAVDTGPDFIGNYRGGYGTLAHVARERGL